MKRPAYTLIELLIVLALIGILLGIVFPNTNYFKSMKESIEVKELKRDMLYARNKAIVECKTIIVSFSIEHNCYKIMEENSSTVKTKYFEHGTTLTGKIAPKSFIFKSNGTTSGSGSIYFYDRSGIKHKLSITPVSGKVNIE